MPTTARRATFHALALRNFERQTYENAHLFVVSEDPIDVEPRHNVTVHTNPEGVSLGRKYNIAHQIAIEAGAEYIALWSDDDWQGPLSLQHRMGAVIDEGALKVGYRNLHFCDLRPGENQGACYFLRCDGAHPNWVTHLSMLIHRSVWEESDGYPDKQRSSDTLFQHATNRVEAMVLPPVQMVAMQHGCNTYGERMEARRWQQWRRRDLTLQDLIGDDARAYLSAGGRR